jgi:hypothetical protein
VAGPPAAAELAGLATALVLAGAAGADDAAAEVGAGAAEVAAAEAGDVVDAAVVDFDELHPAANSRPEAASRPKTR